MAARRPGGGPARHRRRAAAAVNASDAWLERCLTSEFQASLGGGNTMTTVYVSEVRERLKELGRRIAEMGDYL
ncbi:MAG: hypothetical protein FWJ61_04895 [Limnochordales bacterium]